MFKMISQASHVWPDHADWRSGTRLASSLVRLREIGSVAASSHHLAQQMAMQVDYQQSGLIVELGPGLGAITKELYKRVTNRKQFLLIEVGGAFISELKQQFHGVTVIHDSAEWLLKHVKGRRVAAVVSSLPLRSLPNKVVHRIGVALSQVMDAQTRYIQFTYDLRPTESAYFTHTAMEKQYSRIVWRNLPPARVDTFSLAGEPPTNHPRKTLLHTSTFPTIKASCKQEVEQ